MSANAALSRKINIDGSVSEFFMKTEIVSLFIMPLILNERVQRKPWNM